MTRRVVALVSLLVLAGCGQETTRRVEAQARDGRLSIAGERHVPPSSLFPDEFPGSDEALTISAPDTDGVIPASRCDISGNEGVVALRTRPAAGEAAPATDAGKQAIEAAKQAPGTSAATVTVVTIEPGAALPLTDPPTMTIDGWLYHDRFAHRVEIHLYGTWGDRARPLWINGVYDCR